jgi:hypothetical protein
MLPVLHKRWSQVEGRAVLIFVCAGQPGTLFDAGSNQIDIFRGDRKVGPQHTRVVRVVPGGFHHAAGMPGAPLQYVDDLMNQHVGEQVRDKRRFVGLDTIAEDADLRALERRPVSQRTGIQGAGSVACQGNADSFIRFGNCGRSL